METVHAPDRIDMPTPDEIDRDRFYSPDAEDDDSEYELEPPDPAVIAAEERRAREAVEATRVSIDIDEIYRDADRRRGREIVDDWMRDARLRFRFTVKHLLITTALVAIALTLWRLELFGTVLVLLMMISVGGAYLYLLWQESRQQQEADRRRQEMYARNRAHHEKVNRARPTERAEAESIGGRSATPPTLAIDSAEELPDATPRPAFRFRFSLRQLLIAMTVAAVVLGLVSLVGGPANTATLLGFVALFGLVVNALGFEPPGIVVLGWWLILVLYVLLSIVAVVWSGLA
jgi:hypothetical protein